ncbi:MAG: MarC family protein [Anaerolineae bacterium]|nr:MarC family protein [Anaerolineae bacterium]
MDGAFLIKFFGALFALANPFISLPIFLGLTVGQSPAEVRRTAVMVAVHATVMAAVVAVSGDAVLAFFGIGVDHFRLAGGLAILLIGLRMMNGDPEESRAMSAASRESVAFYPLAFPMIIGPGTITTIVIFKERASTAGQHFAFWLAIAAVMLIMGAVLAAGTAIGQLMSQKLRIIVTRLMGMILAAIAVEMIAEGLKALLPVLAQGAHAGT